MLWQWEQVRRHVKGATTITTASMNLLPHIPTNFYEHSKHTGKMNATTISPHDEEPGADLSCRGFLHGLISRTTRISLGAMSFFSSLTHTHTQLYSLHGTERMGIILITLVQEGTAPCHTPDACCTPWSKSLVTSSEAWFRLPDARLHEKRSPMHAIGSTQSLDS